MFALRQALAMVVETLLLLDRAIYLHESLPAGSQVSLHVLFDPLLSPRSTAIVAKKFKGNEPIRNNLS